MDKCNEIINKKIVISGVVQGVGFRPSIYRIAKKYKLKGEIANSTSGVEILVEGSNFSIECFIKEIKINHPPMARIDSISVDIVLPVYFKDFSIVKSKHSSKNIINVPVDIATCKDCVNEINDPNDRRYKYPFTNCTNCGPRYTIIKDIPYDRCKTSMDSFVMCSLCQNEYYDFTNRRFHAQPNACAYCGPKIYLTNSVGDIITTKDPIYTLSSFIKKGMIVAIKGIGGFHLCVDATNVASVERLRRKKNRKDKPFALMSPDIKTISAYAKINKKEEKLISSFKKPIVLLKKLKNNDFLNNISPNNNYVGVMLPYTPIHYLIFSSGFVALVMTSGNLSGEVISIDNEDAIQKLKSIADYFLLHNRDIVIRNDDSIIKYYADKNRIMRRARGYIPFFISHVNYLPSILACGAEIKNTVCLTQGKKAFISQHIGNLESISTYNFFKDTIKHMQYILKIKPEIIVCDYHLGYLGTGYALEQNELFVVRVQHHYAHVVACMVENRVKDPVIGLALDGTGMGIDGTIWGGEVIIADFFSFERFAFLNPVPMPGGEMAIKEPWRMGISYLYNTFGKSFLDLNLPVINKKNKNKIYFLISMINKNINTPYTSSIGRFFDGIASILNICNEITFEGQAAISLESIALCDIKYLYDIGMNCGNYIKLMTSPIVMGVVFDIINGIPIEIISTKFHNTIVSMFVDVCIMAKKNYGITKVVLSGGVFQNEKLILNIKNNLELRGFEVLLHSLMSSNDASLSLGQAVIGANLI